MQNDLGQCPKCGAAISMTAAKCSTCNARFDASSGWGVLPLGSRRGQIQTKWPRWLKWVMGVSLATAGLCALIVIVPGYLDHQAREALQRTKGPLVEILILAIVESEKSVPRATKSFESILSPSCSFAIACGGEVKSHFIEKDGTVNILLSGRTDPILKDKWILLTPRGTSEWHCTTNVPMDKFPTADDKRLNFFWKVSAPSCNPAP